MFVSVKERTNLIGIKKAVGATRNIILLEFLIESTVLCIIGGVLGLILVYIVLAIVSKFADFHMAMSMSNVLVGLILSAVVGLMAGVIPAFLAARLMPVDAIRQG